MSTTIHFLWKFIASVLLVSGSVAQNIPGRADQCLRSNSTANRTQGNGECHVLPGVEEFLQESLFPFVPPSIKFSTEKSAVPSVVARYLKWRWLWPNSIYLLRRVLESSGFTITRRRNENQWLGGWYDRSKKLEVIRPYQKFNRVPDEYNLRDKVLIKKSLRRGMSILGNHGFQFIPETFILPAEMEDFKQAFDTTKDNLWLLKSPLGSKCKGIEIIRRWGEVPRLRGKTVAEKFLTNPYLTDARKVELRIYVLTTGYNPLRIYIADDYIVKGARLNFTYNSDDICLLITQYALYYPENCPHLDYDNLWNRQLIKTDLFKRMASDGLNTTRFEEKLDDMIVKTVLSALGPPVRKSTTRYNVFQFWGIDVLINDSGYPVLLEFNGFPTMTNEYPALHDKKKTALTDALNLLGFHLPPTMSASEKNVHSILETLTPDDVRQLIIAEDELSRAGNFKRVYPSIGMKNYMPLSRFDPYYDMLFDAWETKYHHNRAKGIHRLQLLAAQKFHLNP